MGHSAVHRCALCALILVGLSAGISADSTPPPPPAPYFGPADINGDLALDATDFTLFFCRAWVQYHADGTVDTRADLDKDGAIGYGDAMVFVTEWIKAGS